MKLIADASCGNIRLPRDGHARIELFLHYSQHACYVTLRVMCIGCEYGDRADWCTTYVQGPDDCLQPDVAENCCNTCQRLEPSSELHLSYENKHMDNVV